MLVKTFVYKNIKINQNINSYKYQYPQNKLVCIDMYIYSNILNLISMKDKTKTLNFHNQPKTLKWII